MNVGEQIVFCFLVLLLLYAIWLELAKHNARENSK
jgi:hypothetical protein